MSSVVFGYYAVQIGELNGGYTLLQDSRIQNCFSVAPTIPDNTDPVNSPDLITDPAVLALDFDNIDLVVACHVLDCAGSPHQILREIERVLVAEGHCILIAFNPFSWRGFSILWRKLLRQQPYPALYTNFRIRDWFEVLGFEVLETRTAGVRYTLQDTAVLRKLPWLGYLHDKYCQLFGNVQLIHVKKKVSKLTPIKPSAHRKPLLKPGMAVNSRSIHKIANPPQRKEQ